MAVAGADVAGVVIELAEGASISGVVEKPAGITDEDGFYAMISYAYEGERSNYGNSVGAYDGTFVINSLRAGKVYLNADVNLRGNREGEPAKYYVKSITHNGADLMQKPLAIEAGQSITNVRVVVAENTARARVQLINREGKPVPAKPVFIVSVEPSKWVFLRENAQGMTDVNGTVPLSGAPGEYLVIVGGAEDSWPPSSEIIRARAETAPRIKLLPGDNKIVTVSIGP